MENKMSFDKRASGSMSTKSLDVITYHRVLNVATAVEGNFHTSHCSSSSDDIFHGSAKKFTIMKQTQNLFCSHRQLCINPKTMIPNLFQSKAPSLSHSVRLAF